MKLVLVSDIHLDINKKRKDDLFDQKLVQYLSGLRADGIVIAGDIAGNTSEIVSFMELAESLPFDHKFYIPGNHDVWVNQNAKDLSYVKYYQILEEISVHYGFEYLPKNPLILDNTVFLGTMGWYDYSSRNQIWDDKLALVDYAKKQYPGSTLELMDRYFVKFGMSDIEISNKMIGDLKSDYNFIHRRLDTSDIDQIVIVSHMVPFREFIPYQGILKYDYFTAFFGNFNLGSYIESLSLENKIHSVFGQCHVPNEKQLNPNLTGYCTPIGYPREYGKDISLQKLFQNRVKEIVV